MEIYVSVMITRPSIKKILFAVPLSTHFFVTSGKSKKIAPFSSENHDFHIMQQWKEIFFLPTYPTKKYMAGVQQTNIFF